MFENIEKSPIPIVAAINGVCMGGGLEVSESGPNICHKPFNKKAHVHINVLVPKLCDDFFGLCVSGPA